MSGDRVRVEGKKSSSLIPGSKPKQFSFLQPRYQDQVETDSVEGDRQPENTTPVLGHSFGRMSVRPIQAKLTIGEPNDKYEQEADRVASQVVQQINVPSTAQSTQGKSIQRMDELEEEELQTKPMISPMQRMSMPEEDEELQTKPIVSPIQRSLISPALQREDLPDGKEIPTKSIQPSRGAIASGEASMDLTSAINSARGGGQSLDAGLQKSMGQAMGADFSRVRVHKDSQSDQLNQSLQSLAFTTGQDVFFRQGTYEPGSRGGQELIAHELTHVIQQNEFELGHFQNKVGTPTFQTITRNLQTSNAYTVNNNTNEFDGASTRKNALSKVNFSGANIIQAVWVQTNTKNLYWHVLLDGLQWYYDSLSEKFHYHIVDDLAVPIDIWDDIERYEGEPLTEQDLDALGFKKIADDPSIRQDISNPEEGSGMVSRSVAKKIMENLQGGIPPFKPELGLGGCSWFIWTGFGKPYTSIDKVKRGQERKDIPIDATIRLPESALIFNTDFLAQRHAMYMGDPDWNAEAERKWRVYNEISATEQLNSKNRKNLEFYKKGSAEREMWVSIGQMVAAHPSGVGIVMLENSNFSREGDGRFLVVADASKINIEGGHEAISERLLESE